MYSKWLASGTSLDCKKYWDLTTEDMNTINSICDYHSRWSNQ